MDHSTSIATGAVVTSDGNPLEPQITIPQMRRNWSWKRWTVSVTQAGQAAAQQGRTIQIANSESRRLSDRRELASFPRPLSTATTAHTA